MERFKQFGSKCKETFPNHKESTYTLHNILYEYKITCFFDDEDFF